MSSSAVGHIRDEEFAGLSLDELDENEHQKLARAGLPLLLPWHREHVRLGAGYHSSRQMTTNPWASETPFVLADLMMQAKIFQSEQGTTSTFTSIKTSRFAETNDHLTLGIGIGVSPPIPVVKVSVKGTYDKHIQQNSDHEKHSIRASCRAGCIDLQTGPRLTLEAIAEIKHGGGFERFCERYGDYYVAGYRLGADTGLLLSASSSSRLDVDKTSVTATAKVAFVSASKKWEKDFHSFRSGRLLKLLGFDTLEGRNWKNADAEGDANREIEAWLGGKTQENKDSLKSDAATIIERSHTLIERVGSVLKAHNIKNGASLTFKQCEALVQAGVVVELLLLPMHRLREVVQWRLNENII